MADVVAIDGERVPLDESLLGVDEGGAGVVVEEKRVAANHLQIHGFRSTVWRKMAETLDANWGKVVFGVSNWDFLRLRSI